MKHTAAKFFRTLCGMVVMLTLAAGITSISVSAASNGIYIAAATPHYRHPRTGIIEDSGGEGSAVLGQSMTESATYDHALVEVDESGNTYVTVRLKLMDNIENPQFQVDGAGNGSFQSVSCTVMQEDFSENTTDFRMKVPNENAVIRCNMYVIPMGREVVFYITVSNLKSGSGDFVTSIKAADQPKTTVTGAQTSKTTVKQTSVQTRSQTTQKVTEKTTVQTTATAASEKKTSETTTSTQAVTTEASVTETSEATEYNSEEKTAAGLQEFNAEGEEVPDEASESSDDDKGSSSAVVWCVIGGIAVIAAAGFCVWYFCFFKKKK